MQPRDACRRGGGLLLYPLVFIAPPLHAHTRPGMLVDSCRGRVVATRIHTRKHKHEDSSAYEKENKRLSRLVGSAFLIFFYRLISCLPFFTLNTPLASLAVAVSLSLFSPLFVSIRMPKSLIANPPPGGDSAHNRICSSP